MTRLKPPPPARRRRKAAPTETSIIESLIAIRRRSGLTTLEVARRMQVTSPAVSQLELCHRRGQTVTLDRLLRYAAAIGAEIHIRRQPPPPEFNQ